MRTILITSCILLTALICVAQPVNGLVAYYPFDGTAIDQSGNGNDGAIFGATPTMDRFGNPSSALYFNGNSYVQGNSLNPLQGNASAGFSFSLWYRADQTGNNWTQLIEANIRDANGVVFDGLAIEGIFTQGIDFALCETHGLCHDTWTSTFTIGEWHHLVGTYDGTTQKIYIDGTVASAVDWTGTVTIESGLAIGRDYEAPIQYFVGAIDEILIYDRSLTATEVNSIFGTPGSVFTFSDSTMSDWNPFGSPSPVWLQNAHGRNGIFDNNGGGSGNCGAYSDPTFNLSGGFELSGTVYLELLDANGNDAEAVIGITNASDIVNLPYVMLNLAHRGANCGASSPEYCSHTYLYGWYLTDCGYVNFGDYYHETDMINADQYVNGWHTLRIVVDSVSMLPAFYIDSDLLFLGSAPLAMEVIAEDRSTWIGARSAGDAGKAYHDQVCISQGGSHGMVPQPESLTIQVIGNDVHLDWTPSYTCNTDQVSYAVFYETDSEADYEFLSLTGANSYVHEHVVRFESSMYYNVVAYNMPQAQLFSLIGGLGTRPRKSEIDRILTPLGVEKANGTVSKSVFTKQQG